MGQTVWQQLSKALIYDIVKFLVIDSDFGMRNCSLLFLMAHRKVIVSSTKKVPQHLKGQHRKFNGGDENIECLLLNRSPCASSKANSLKVENKITSRVIFHHKRPSYFVTSSYIFF